MRTKSFINLSLLLCLLVGVMHTGLSAQELTFEGAFQKLKADYEKEKAPLKLEMLDFIKNNIAGHYTQNYYWVDSTRNKVDFDELAYGNFNSAVVAFNSIKANKGRLSPVPTRINDQVGISLDIIHESIERTYAHMHGTDQRQKQLAFEYLLPYRVMTEPAYIWRQPFYEKFKFFVDENKDPRKSIRNIIDNINLWFICTYNIEKRTDPIPFLGSLQILHRKKGGCEDAANLLAFALRSVGMPCAVDVVPLWGTSTGGHVLNTAFDTYGNPIHVDMLINSDSLYEMIREPAKVFRMTYSVNKNALANRLNAKDIPDHGLLRSVHYTDVTREYWNTSDLVFTPADTLADTIFYATVFNGGKWKPAWYAEKKNGQVQFTDMVEGVAYAPAVYRNRKLLPAGNPKAYSKGQVVSFDPSDERHTIVLTELPGYLKIREGVTYTLYYFDGKWRRLKERKVKAQLKKLTFLDVPKNALLLLKPDDSQGKERPFTIAEDGTRSWW